MKRQVSFALREAGDAPQATDAAAEEVHVMDGTVKVGSNVWLRNQVSGQPYTLATLVSLEKSGDAVVRLAAGGDILRVQPDSCYAANSADVTPGDHSALIHLNEPCVLENTKLRYT